VREDFYFLVRRCLAGLGIPESPDLARPVIRGRYTDLLKKKGL